jgi:hypothetical protein
VHSHHSQPYSKTRTDSLIIEPHSIEGISCQPALPASLAFQHSISGQDILPAYPKISDIIAMIASQHRENRHPADSASEPENIAGQAEFPNRNLNHPA